MRIEPTNRSKPRPRAFTLIELILVMTVLLITTALVAPSLMNFFRGRALDSEAWQLLSLTRAGQSRAVSEGEPILLWVDAKTGTYGLQEEAPAAGGDPKAVSLNVADGLQIQVENATSSLVKLGNLPAIRFLPGGTIDENSSQSLRLTDASGNTLWLVESANHMSYEIREIK
jgi:prepilin-type N-terminal cleavage/methylation domain-containing protein